MRKARVLPEPAIRRKVCGEKSISELKSALGGTTRMPHSRDSLVLLPGGRRPLQPPPELREGSDERAVFVQVAASVPDGHFAPEDVGLLAEYARTATLARFASEELLANPVVGKTVNPWLATHASAIRQLAMLATRLRIGPRSRSANTRKAKPVSPPSYYDLHPATPPPTPPSKEGDPWKRQW
jgi:hypothetical protein